VLPVVFSFRTEGPPHPLQLAGFALALVGIWLMTTQRGGPGNSKGMGLAVMAGIGFSGFLLFIKVAGTRSVFWPLVSARTASCLLMAGIILLTASDWKPSRGSVRFVLLAGVLDSGANALYVAATQRGRLDVAAVLSSLYPVSTVVLARLVLKEKLSRLQTIGVAATLSAILMIAAG
jgi:drug/metabolite transporter (DMT)-like permease